MVPETTAKHRVWERGWRQLLTIFEWEVALWRKSPKCHYSALRANPSRHQPAPIAQQTVTEQSSGTGAQLTTAAVCTTCKNSLPVIGGSYQRIQLSITFPFIKGLPQLLTFNRKIRFMSSEHHRSTKKHSITHSKWDSEAMDALCNGRGHMTATPTMNFPLLSYSTAWSNNHMPSISASSLLVIITAQIRYTDSGWFLPWTKAFPTFSNHRNHFPDLKDFINFIVAPPEKMPHSCIQ